MGFSALAILALLCGFADQLYQQGDYQMAALEYSRLLYEAGDTLSMPEEALKLARCRHLLGDPEGALSLYTYLIGGLPDGDWKARALLGAGAVYADLGFTSLSEESYWEAAEAALDSDLVYRGLLLQSLSPLHRFEWSRSSEMLGSISRQWEGERGTLASQLSLMASSGRDLPRRSPFWCGVASAVLPGSGQILSGHTRDGLIALGMTAATGALLYVSIEEDNLSTSILLGWLSFSFYGANIYGGSRAAEYYNSTRRRELLQEVYGRLETRYASD